MIYRGDGAARHGGSSISTTRRSREPFKLMRALVFAWVLILVAAPTPARVSPRRSRRPCPRQIVDVTGWETIVGELETPTARGAYVFAWPGDHQAIYQVMRYRVELLSPATEGQRNGRAPSALRLSASQGPVSRCCVGADPTGAAPAWRALVAGSDEYKLEMAMLIQVIGVHRAARSAGPADQPSRAVYFTR